MVVRRQTDPIHIKTIWNAISIANQHKAPTDIGKISKFIENEDYTPGQIELHIKQALNDKLIVPIKKGDAFSPHQTYKLPFEQELPIIDGKDWYCFECHLAGDIIECANCVRVFHKSCIYLARERFEEQRKAIDFSKINESTFHYTPSTSAPILDDEEPIKEKPPIYIEQSKHTFDNSLCCICNILKIDTSSSMGKDLINYVLRYVLQRIRAWVPETITQTLAPEDHPSWLSDSEMTWRANHLFREYTDMSVIEVKLNTDTYNMLTEFLGDVFTIHHNVTIFHGSDTQESGASKYMMNDAVHDLWEIRKCFDCYRHSNEKGCMKWFCVPCRNPHKVVWAKQKGYSYWPAKVVKVSNRGYDVRFFGGKYERSVLPKSLIKPFEIPKEKLMIKPTKTLNRALEEVKYYKSLLVNPLEMEKILAQCEEKRRIMLNTFKSNTQIPQKSKKNAKLSRKKSTTKSPKKRNSSPKKIITVSTTIPSKRTHVDMDSSCISLIDLETRKRKLSSDTESNSNYTGNNVIAISDGEEEDIAEYSYRQNNTLPVASFNLDESIEPVSSSTENFGKVLSPRSEFGMQPLDQPYSDSVEKLRRKLECLTDKSEMIKCAMDCMQIEIDRITNDHNDHLKRLFESHNQQISETKKKQWCYNCEQDAIYHCCWNTAYCSQTCQQQHWHAEHKKVCRRKR